MGADNLLKKVERQKQRVAAAREQHQNDTEAKRKYETCLKIELGGWL